MPVQQVIESKLQAAFDPAYLQVDNESHKHGGPARESHFKVTLVSNAFNEKLPIKRHQKVYELLAEELSGVVHALALHLYTEPEWEARQKHAPRSPDCRGGSLGDH
jgi:BolA protein